MLECFCPICEKWLPFTPEFFNKKGVNKNGIQLFKNKCKLCDRTYQRNQSINKIYKKPKKKQKSKPIFKRESLAFHAEPEHNKHRKKERSNFLSTSRANAKRRGYNHTLTLNDIDNLWQEPCFYCGMKISRIGLDRFNNNKGYHFDNVVPCCYSCNAGKQCLSYEDFIEKCYKITERHLKPKKESL